MKKTMGLFIGFILLAALPGSSQELTVIIKGIKDSSGKIGLALYNNEKDFMKRDLQSSLIDAKAGEVTITLNNIATGKYALSIMHDANGNDELDSGFFGIPKEGFGFSNDAMGTFGPPDFNKASFDFRNSKTVVINLRYL